MLQFARTLKRKIDCQDRELLTQTFCVPQRILRRWDSQQRRCSGGQRCLGHGYGYYLWILLPGFPLQVASNNVWRIFCSCRTATGLSLFLISVHTSLVRVSNALVCSRPSVLPNFAKCRNLQHTSSRVPGKTGYVITLWFFISNRIAFLFLVMVGLQEKVNSDRLTNLIIALIRATPNPSFLETN